MPAQPIKQSLENLDSTTAQTHQDVQDIGDVVDYSKMTLEQLKDEFRKFRLEHNLFKQEMRHLIADEIEHQIKPLQEQLKQFTTDKKKIIFLKQRVLLLDILKWLWDKRRVWIRKPKVNQQPQKSPELSS